MYTDSDPRNLLGSHRKTPLLISAGQKSASPESKTGVVMLPLLERIKVRSDLRYLYRRNISRRWSNGDHLTGILEREFLARERHCGIGFFRTGN